MFFATYDYLYKHHNVLAVLRWWVFVFAGWVSNRMATWIAGLKGAVPFYATHPSAAETAAYAWQTTIEFFKNNLLHG